MYNPPRPPEVYTLHDNLNEALPAEIRQAFQHDSNGRVLFFTAPPLDRLHKGVSHESAGLGHSVKYLAGRKEWLAEREKKRKERDEQGSQSSQKCLEAHGEATRQTKEDVVSQASDAMAKWLEHFDEDTEKWTKETGLGGWGEARKETNAT